MNAPINFHKFICNGILWGTLLSLPSVSLAEPYECGEIASVVSVVDAERPTKAHCDSTDTLIIADDDGHNICFLTSVQMNEIGTNGEWGYCQVYRTGGDWVLEARTEKTDGCHNDVECMASCFKWEYQ